MENYYTAKKLIQKRIEAERLVASIQTEFDDKKRDIELQTGLAQKGLNNILAFEEGRAAKIQLRLIIAQQALDSINTEIETHKLAADLNRSNESTKASKTSEKKYYSDKDFNTLIDELFEKEMFEVDDFLEYHFSQAFFSDSMSRFNWLTSLRKNLIHRFPAPDNIGKLSYTVKEANKTPDVTNMAFLWERNKNVQLIEERNNRSVTIDKENNFEIDKNNAENKIKKAALPVIALSYQYLREEKLHEGINEQNRDKLAKQYQWTAKSSGRKLHDYYKRLHTESDRITPRFSDSPVSKQSTIKNMENAIAFLATIPQSEKAVLKAKKELQKIQQS